MPGVSKRYRSFVKVDRPVGIKLPRRMRCIQRIIKVSDTLFIFQRRQVNTLYTNPHIYSSKARHVANHLNWLMPILNGLRLEIVTEPELGRDITHWYPDYPDMEEYDA